MRSSHLKTNYFQHIHRNIVVNAEHPTGLQILAFLQYFCSLWKLPPKTLNPSKRVKNQLQKKSGLPVQLNPANWAKKNCMNKWVGLHYHFTVFYSTHANRLMAVRWKKSTHRFVWVCMCVTRTDFPGRHTQFPTCWLVCFVEVACSFLL